MQPTIAPIRIPAQQSDSDLLARFVDSTRHLLRQRLRIASLCLLCLSATFLLLSIVTGRSAIPDLLMSTVVIGILVATFAFVDRAKQATLTQLRVVELVVLFAPIAHVLAVLVRRTNLLLDAGEVGQILGLRPTIGAAIALFIAVYGMFIPSTWQRTAVIGFVAAVLQPIVMFLHSVIVPEVGSIDDPNFATTVLTLFAAVAATLAAHIVHRIRREVEEARTYGQYQLREEIGRGGMGVVYRAEHRLLKRPAAIKLIRPEVAADAKAIVDFEREVQLSATLSHWNTVQIYDYGVPASGDFYYVMEFLEGLTLRDRIKSAGSLSANDTIATAKQICAGLIEAHDKGMVHRDLKPENIFLAYTGGYPDIVKIVDFGLAIVTATTSTSDQRRICGTPLYMSPEQALGTEVTPASDVYSLGCILFECLTGTYPFHAGSITELLNKQVYQLPPLEQLPDSAGSLHPVIEQCLRKIATDRYADARMLLAALENCEGTTL